MHAIRKRKKRNKMLKTGIIFLTNRKTQTHARARDSRVRMHVGEHERVRSKIHGAGMHFDQFPWAPM